MYGSLHLESLQLDWAAELRDVRVWVRRGAAHHLARCPQLAHGAVEPLAAALADEDAGVRKWAACALDAVGPAAFESLLAALGHARAPARAYAARLLGRLGPAARPAAAELERVRDEDADSSVRLAALEALQAISGA